MPTCGNTQGVALTPYWVETNPLLAFNVTTPPANYSTVAAGGGVPVNPFGGNWIQNDETGSTGSAITLTPGGRTVIPPLAPDTTKRWCERKTWLYAKSGSATETIVGTTGAGNGSEWITENSDGTLTAGWDAYSAAQGTFALSANTVYMLELIAVKVSGGVSLNVPHGVFRIWTLNAAGSSPTLQETRHFYPGSLTPVSNSLLIPFNASSGRKQWFSHVVCNCEDADDLFNAPRVAWYQPSANGAENTNWNNATAQWLEVPPDDATSVRQPLATGAKATSTLAAGAGSTSPGASDQVSALTVLIRTICTGTKGATGQLDLMTCDGNTAHETFATDCADTSDPGNAWHAKGGYFGKRPDGAAGWAQTDIATTEIGSRGIYSSGSPTMSISSIQGFFAWGKSGETMTAVPGPDLDYRKKQYFVTTLAPKQRGRHFVSMAPPAAAGPPVTPNRRRWVWVS